MKNSIRLILLFGILLSCKKPEVEVITPTYYIQMYSEENSELANFIGREFGKMQTLKNEFITNDSSAYIWAWKSVNSIKSKDKDNVLSVNEFKLFDENEIDITNTVSFEGIENYPNPIK